MVRTGRGCETAWTYVDVPLHHVVDISGAVLIELDMMAGPFLCFTGRRWETTSSTRSEGGYKWTTRTWSEPRIRATEIRRTKYNDCDIDGAQHAELVCLLEETVLALCMFLSA